jgi:hypothetical protein
MIRKFNLQQWATVSPSSGWRIIAGDFDGNSRADIVGYHSSNGSVCVGENNGDSAHFRTLGPQ